MARHLVVVVTGLLILLSVWYTFQVKPMLEKGKGKITVTLDGQPRVMTSDEISSEIVRLRGERDAAQRRADELEEGKAQLLSDLDKWQELAKKAARQPKLPDPKDGGEAAKDPTEEALQKALASTDWAIYIGAILKWIEADEESRRTGKPAAFDPKTIQLLSEYTMKLTELAKILGVADYQEVAYHEKVSPHFFEGWMKGVGVTLSEDQRAKLSQTSVEFSRSRQKELSEVKGANALERMAWDAGRDMRWSAEMKGVLTPEQYETYMKPIGNDPFWGRQAARRDISAETPAGAATAVGNLWAKSFGLDESGRATIDEVATRYVQDYQRRTQDFQARYAANPPREEQMRLGVELLQLQIEAERQLGQRLTLTPEQQEKVRGGTGTVLQIGVK